MGRSSRQTITMEIRSWSLRPDGMVEGLAYNDTRGLFSDREFCAILPDKNFNWQDFGSFFRVRSSDTFGDNWFRLDKHEEDKR